MPQLFFQQKCFNKSERKESEAGEKTKGIAGVEEKCVAKPVQGVMLIIGVKLDSVGKVTPPRDKL